MTETRQPLRAPIEKIKPAGCENCKGHGNEMLDNTYEDPRDVALMIRICDNYGFGKTDKK